MDCHIHIITENVWCDGSEVLYKYNFLICFGLYKQPLHASRNRGKTEHTLI